MSFRESVGSYFMALQPNPTVRDSSLYPGVTHYLPCPSSTRVAFSNAPPSTAPNVTPLKKPLGSSLRRSQVTPKNENYAVGEKSGEKGGRGGTESGGGREGGGGSIVSGDKNDVHGDEESSLDGLLSIGGSWEDEEITP